MRFICLAFLLVSITHNNNGKLRVQRYGLKIQVWDKSSEFPQTKGR